MGLDMYIYETPKNNVAPGGLDVINDDMISVGEDDHFFYWRKHPDLHGWFEQLYVSKGGREGEFNSAWVEITEDDTRHLKESVLSDKLPYTTGFFFGQSKPDHKDNTVEFISRAETFWKEQKGSAQPKTLMYFCSW